MSTVRIPTRQRRWPAFVIGGVVVLAVLFTVMSTFYIDLLWYREIDQSGVFWTELRTKVALGTVFGLLFFGLLYANLLVTRRLAPPPLRFLTPEQEAIERLRMSFEPFLGWALPVGAAALALLVGIGVSRQWQVFLLWRHSSGVEFGDVEPLFQRDPAFYVFSLPWLKFLQGWLFSTLVGITFLTAIAHFFWGGIRPQARTWGERVAPATRAHLSVLLGLIMLVKAWGYYLGRFDLLTSRRGVVQGASYTDVNAQLPALNFLIIAAVICAVLFFANIWRQRWALPIIAVIVLGAVSVLLGTAYPAFVQRFRVTPQEFQREQEYIADNIAGTTTAFDIEPGGVEAPPEQSYEPQVTAAQLRANQTTKDNIRLWRPSIIGQNFQSLQRFRSFYEFRDVDVDRYDIDGERNVLMVSGREVSQAGIQAEARTWQNEHLVYTHGYGAVAARVNTANAEGAPIFTLSDLPPPATDQPALEEPRIYFGEGDASDASFVITKTKTPELDYEGAPSGYEYQGTGGIEVGNVVQRALFAWRFRDVNLLISGQIVPTSRIMIYRDIYARAPKPVPFLTFDRDPYLTIVDGRLVWIWDAYTTTNEYPYSESINLQDATEGDLPSVLANYMRNAVKVTVDAYEGSMTYYADTTDPIIQVWARAYPGLFTDVAEAPEEVRAHFRYPENLFQVQATQYANYHVTDPEVFYQKQDRWEIAADPTQQPIDVAAGTTSTSSLDAAPRLRPYYLLMRAPGEAEESFQLVLPFVPEGRQNMVAWLAAESDPGENYGRLLSLELPASENVPGPSIVFSRINQDPQFSSERTLLGQGGSTVLFGDLLVIPMANSFLYVQPVYVQANQSAAVPELKRVVVANGDVVGVGQTLDEALAESVAGQVEPDGDGGGDGGVDRTVAELLAEAAQHFEAADAALREGDLATYQEEIRAAQDLVAQALELSGATPPVEGEAAASPSPSASPTP
ncbi:MAG TPA: UPF0182 family protein [Actinomycetota bacterium]|nr:UPF0182 family protein [Actinomycetota bacterium]